MARRVALLGATTVVFVATSFAAVDYGKTMTAKVQQALGKQSTKHFKFASYPVDNFGVATAYDKSGTELCATWTCLANDDDVPTDPKSLLSITTKSGVRYADVGTGGTINLTDEQKRNIGIQILLPQLLKVIGVTANIGSTKDIHTDLDLGQVSIRKIIPDRVMERINSLPAGASEKIAFQQKGLRLVYADIVVASLKVTLNVDTSANADTDAKLNGALSGKVGSVIGGSGTDLSVKVDGSTKGKYVLEVVGPVILATWTKLRPAESHLAITGIASWPDESVPGDKVFTITPN